MLTCEHCVQAFKNVTTLRNHIRKDHGDISSFKCLNCTKTFKNKCSLVTHSKQHTETATETLISEPKPETLKRARETEILVLTDYGRSTSFEDITCFPDWLTRYGILTGKLSSSSMESILSDFKVVHNNNPQLFIHLHTDTSAFVDDLDHYLDTESVAPGTLIKRLRAIRWYVRYMSSTYHNVRVEVLDELDEMVQSTQSASTVLTVSHSIIGILDPIPLARVSDRVINILRHEQPTIDLFMLRCYESTVPAQERIQFGLQTLRLFIELALRFTNVPLRIQCTIGMHLSSQNMDNVCTLVRVLDTGAYARIVSSDKVKNHAQAVRIHMDATISKYLDFYIRYCRIDTSSTLVFQSAHGKKWITASADLKAYLCKYGLDCDTLVPNGRFVHFSRHIGLAVFSILANFNVEQIRNFALLMRHSMAAIEYIYSPWLRLSQSISAAHDVLRLRNQDTLVDRVAYLPITSIERIRGMLDSYIRNEMGIDGTPVVCRYVDAGVQTDSYEKIEKVELVSTQQPPTCTVCYNTSHIGGPIGNTKHAHFGKYYAFCKTCHKNSGPEAMIVTYVLGEKPVYVETSSTKPRNRLDIMEYIFQKTQKRVDI
jgi:hypothetical protein